MSKNSLLALAALTIKSAQSKLDVVSLGNLHTMINDTSINKANIGAFFLATGASPDAALFLICHSIIENPGDIWAINDLGVYYRNTMDYERSLQCFLYANTLDTGKNTAINTNIGWASAYYGDFDAANKYFNKALSVNQNFQSANEGEATVAYARGDIKALFQCLAKEIKYIGGGGSGGGPSGTFASTCGGVYSQNNAENGGNPSSDPGNDHTFDNSSPDDAPDAPPGADVDDIMFPKFRKAFVSKPEDIAQGFKTGTEQGTAAMHHMKSRVAQLIQMQKGLKPLGQKPYTDAEGYLIYPTNFEKYVDLLAPIDELLGNRLAWYRGKLSVKLKALNKDVSHHDADMVKQYLNALAACNDDGACERRVKCDWLPRLYGSKNNDLDVIARMWDDYYKKVFGAIQWYVDATGPLISHVHQQGWNQFLNARRQYRVRVAIIGAYSMWTMALGEILTDMCAVIKLPTPDCPPIEMRGVSAPNPFSKKPKHIKEFEGKCYNMKFDCGIGGIEENCHTTKFFIGIGPAKLFLEHVDDPIYAQNHEYANKVGGTLSADMMIGLNSDNEYKEMGLDPEEQFAGAKAGIDAKVEGTLWLQFNANNQITGVGVEGSASAEAGFSGEVKGGAKVEANSSVGIEGTKSWQLVASQNGWVGNPGTVKVKTN